MGDLTINEDFGKHLIIDITVTDNGKAIINNKDMITLYLDTMTRICGMQAVIPTIAMQFPFNSELCGLVKKLEQENVQSETLKEYSKYVKSKEDNDTGVSAFSIWNTSHMSAHSWVEENYISIDLYSCKDFDTRKVLDYTKEFFNIKEMRIVEIMRHFKKPQKIKQWEE